MSAPLPPETAVVATVDRSGIAGHPRGLTTLFFTEMWERFSYYGMRALLVLFMTRGVAEGGLGYGDRKATAIFGTYSMSVYLLCILGGYLADNFTGARRAVLWGGVVIACGHFSMAMPGQPAFFAGLALVALGTGLLKPNVSTMVGELYPAGDPRRDAGFSIFYMGINLGGLSAAIACGFIAQHPWFRLALEHLGLDPRQSWHWGFGTAGVGMTIGLVIFVLRRTTLQRIGCEPAVNGGRPWGRLLLVGLASLALVALMMAADRHRGIVVALCAAQVAAVFFFASRRGAESRRIAAILVFFLTAQVFSAFFNQGGSSLALFADRLTDNRFLGWAFPSTWWQSVNALWVVILGTPIAWLWSQLGARQPSSPAKFALGLFLVSVSFAWMIPAARLTVEGRVSPLWLLVLFFLQTLGELCLMPVGLSTMTKLAPARLAGLVMGIWFLAGALGNKLAGIIAGHFVSTDPESLVRFFGHQALGLGVAAVAVLALGPWVRRLMGGVR